MEPILRLFVNCLSYEDGSLGHYLNVHTKADIAKCIMCVYLPERPSKDRLLGRQELHASEVLQNNTGLVSQLAHALIVLFGDVEKVGVESAQYRKYITNIIRYLWNNPKCQETVVRMKEEQEIVQNFAHSLITNLSKLTGDAFDSIPQIRTMMEEMLKPEFSQLSETERDEKQLQLNQLRLNVTYSFDLTTETLQLLLDASTLWGDVWMNSMVIKPLAVSLPRLVKQLVGKEGISLRIVDPEKYHFDKDELLSLLIRVILVFSENDQYIMCMIEEMTLELKIFINAQTICRKRNLLTPDESTKMASFVKRIHESQAQVTNMENLLETAPEEYLDGITGELMTDPIQLPNSKMIMDRSTIESCLLKADMDPFDRTHLSKDMLIPLKELKERIVQWKKENNYLE